MDHVRIWLLSSALESEEGRVRTAHTTITSREWQQYYLLFSLWLVTNKVTQLWLRADS